MANHTFTDLMSWLDKEAINNDNYYRDPNHIAELEKLLSEGKIDELSNKLARFVRQKKYGIDVRESIARAIEWTAILSNQAVDESKETSISQDKLQSRVDAFTTDFNDKYERQIAGNTDLNEIIDARKDFTTLGGRLNYFDDEKADRNQKEIDLLNYGFIANDKNAKEHNNKLFQQIFQEKEELVINVPANHRFWIGDVTVSRGEMTIGGGGTLTGRFICDEGYLKNHFNFSNIRFQFDSLEEGNNPIVFSKMTRSWVKNCYFLNCDKAISYKSIDHAQQVSRILLDNNYFRDVNYALYGDKNDVTENTLIAADIQFTNNMVEACHIEHVHVEGFDGGIISNNTFFFPSHTKKDMVKKHNIFIDYCEWTIISNNNLFEAGEDGIHLEHAEDINITGNNIAWCGQKTGGSGIKLVNYNKSGGIVNKGVISNNLISMPSESGIYIDDHTGYITVIGNSVYGAGETKNYYGTDEIEHKDGIFLGSSSQGVVVTGNNISHNNITNLGNVNVLKNNLTLHNTGHTSDVMVKNYTVTIPAGRKIANFATNLNTDDILGAVIFYTDTSYNNPASVMLNANSTMNIITNSNVSADATYTVKVSYRQNLKA